jgi:5'-methylthioadenosine phosphorylase
MNGIKVGLIGGSGLGLALSSQTEGRRHEVQTPFGPPSDAIVETEWDGVPVLFLSRHGPGHVLNPSQVPFRANIFALKQLGCTHVIASGACGSLREEFRPRDLVVPDQIIDKTQRRAGTFFDGAAVHVEFAEPFCPVLRQVLLEASRSLDGGEGSQGLVVRGQEEEKAAESGSGTQSSLNRFSVHDRGCYVCMEGPAFSTRAESLMHRLWGGDLIGMTAMPEAKLAREAEMSYALVALVTDYDCWRNQPAANNAPQAELNKQELLREIIGNLNAATENAIRVIKRSVSLIAGKREALPASPAHRALELAIWSDKGRIPPEEVQRLAPLWIKYFGTSS